ncbi:hypothetical protein MASR2M66_04890 [Chloroflexota bacterium]
MDTGELEPLLPQWLREARESSKQEEDVPETQAPPMPEKTPAPASNKDFLAGLQSQSEDDGEEEVPDWLASITGTAAPKQKVDEPAATDGIKWMEPDHQDDSQQKDEVPDWLAGLQAQGSGGDEKDELTDFLRDTAEPARAPISMDEGSSSNKFEQPQNFNDADSQSFAPSADSDTPDWLKQMSAEAEAPSAPPAPAFDMPDDTPDWLKDMSGGETQTPAEAEAPSILPDSAFDMPNDTPDWLKDMSDGEAQTPATPQASAFDMSGDTPDWLSGLSEGSAPFTESTSAESEALLSDIEIPSWLTPEVSRTIDPVGETDERAAGDSLFGDMPDWLRSAAPETSIFDDPVEAAPAAEVEAASPESGLSFDGVPAFESDSLLDSGDGLFTEMPDWLSAAMDAPADAPVPEAITGSDALAPDVLPSWVEAMRPVDQTRGMSLAAALSSSGPAESQGALAGLSGVLPAGTGFMPTSKPKAQSIKLNATEDQLKQAGVLEQILAAENSPVALTSEQMVGASRSLRWGLAFVFLALTFALALMGTQIFSTPVGIPPELKTAVSIVQVIPLDAPVLVAFDYDPARAGEMEAAAAPFFDNMMLLNHPHLTFIASNEYGATLAERFINGPLAGRGYQNGITYLNLGYIPGGHLGIRAFAQAPAQTAPFDINSQPAWSLPPLQNVTLLNQFAAIILITDDAEAARSWVEQTQTTRGAVPLLVVSSAQSAPMIQPYYESGQVQGLVSGLYGGAIVERQYNNGSPGLARRYWDGYSVGMLLAALFLFGGGLLNLALGLRDRAAAKEDK